MAGHSAAVDLRLELEEAVHG